MIEPSHTDVEDQFDYGADADPDQEIDAGSSVDLDKLVLQAERVIADRENAEAALAKLKKREEQLLHKEIPEFLLRCWPGFEKCTTASGIEIKIKRDIRAAMPGHERVEARLAAMRWLVEHGDADVIKNNVTVTFDRGEDARADDLVVELRARGFAVESKKDVAANTLGARVRERMAEGKVVPRKMFNLFDMRIVQLAPRVK